MTTLHTKPACTIITGLLAATALTQLHAQEVRAQQTEAQEAEPQARPGKPVTSAGPPRVEPSEDRQDETGRTPDTEAEFRIFMDSDGNPLPADIQAELREMLANNPDAVVRTERRENFQQGDIVVSGERGAVIGDLPPERSFSQTDLHAYGASSLGDLIDALGPQVASNRGRGDIAPVTLLNGRRVSDFTEIARIPSEAIERLDVFPEELALQYGYRADQKVVNVVTFKSFQSQFGQLALLAPTAGGFANGRIEADHFQIEGDTRFSVAASYAQSSALLESERDLVQPQASRTLIPENDRFELRGLVSRPLGGTVSATLNGRYGESDSRSLLGLDPGFAGDRALQRDSQREEAQLGTTLNGRFGQWVWTATANYERVRSEVDTDVPGRTGARDSADSVSSTLETDVLASGSLFDLPAGALRANFSGGFEMQDFDATSLRGGIFKQTDLRRRTDEAQISLDIPIFEDGSGLGRLSTFANFGIESLSDIRDLTRHGYGLAWSPVEAIGFVASTTREEGAPTLLQLGGPVIETPNVRTFDFARGEVVDVLRISGGNLSLLPDDRDVLRLGLTVRPIALTDLTLSVDYVSTRIDDPIASLPVLLPEVEAAFSERFTRDGDGRLAQIDARPVNLARSEQEQLRWGVNFTRPLGPTLPGAREGSGRTFSSMEEAQRAFPGATVMVAEPGSALARRAENSRSRVYMSVYHNWYLEDVVMLAPGGPALDLLDGDALDFSGGRRRHEVELQGGVFKRGLGARVDLAWRSGSEVRGGPDGGLRFDSFATVDINLFADVSQRFGGADAPGWLQGARVSLNVSNIFNTRQQVHDAQGAVPLAYQSAYFDPLGRTIGLSLRKVF